MLKSLSKCWLSLHSSSGLPLPCPWPRAPCQALIQALSTAPVMVQQGQASAPHSLPSLASGPAKLDPSTDPHPGQSSAHRFPQESVRCLSWDCPRAPGCCAPGWTVGCALAACVTGIMRSDADSALKGHSKPAFQEDFLNVCVRLRM